MVIDREEMNKTIIALDAKLLEELASIDLDINIDFSYIEG